MSELLQSMRGFGSTRALVLGGVGIVLLVIFAFLSLRITSPVMSTLYSNLTQEDSGAIATELGAMGIQFEVASNGSEIMAPSADILTVRMMLAQKGLPNKGSIVGYEVFDKEDALGTSSFVHNVNLVRALEGELARTIGSFSTVKSARVHLVLPRKEMFKRTAVEPSASVVLTLNGSVTFPKEQVFAITHLVASAVPGLQSSNVTIVDSNGKLLARGVSAEEEKSSQFSTANASEFQESYQARMKSTIESLLEKTVGLGAVKAEVTAEIAFDRVTTSSEDYNPEGQVARSVQSTTETEQSTSGQETVSVQTNLPNAAGAGGAGGGAGSNIERIDEVTNFEISKTVTNKISEVGTVKRISVAVLVDGTYTTDEAGVKTYRPRGDEEIAQLEALVKTATGFDEKRGDTVKVINMQFSNDFSSLIPEQGPMDWLANDLDSILKTVVIGVVAILAILLVIRPLVMRAFEFSGDDMQMKDKAGSVSDMLSSGALGAEGLDEPAAPKIELSEIQSRVESSPTGQINQIVDSNPDATLDVIRGWMTKKA